MRALLLILSVFMATVTPSGAAVVRLLEDAPGQYRIEGEALAGVASLDLVVIYDPATLSLSAVIQGPLLQGMLFAANPNQAGRVHIGAVHTGTLAGTGALAQIRGSIKTVTPIILGFTAMLYDDKGKSLPVQVEYPLTQIEVPIDSPLPDSAAESSVSGVSSSWGSSDVVAILPRNSPSERSSRDDLSSILANQNGEARDVGAREKTGSFFSSYSLKPFTEVVSILKRFLDYEGERTPQALIELFQHVSAHGITQAPEIAISDGVSKIRVIIDDVGDQQPSFAFRNAKLVRDGRDGNGGWFIDILPKKGVDEVAIVIFCGDIQVVMPLTVARLREVDLDGKSGLTEADFTHYLNLPPRGAISRAQDDRDGAAGAVEDYIFTANYIIAKKLAQSAGRR
jgi:hypothetical protein